ncbi:MAG: aminopeptidase P family protein [Bacteroidota bacterium]|nr:aminopeptidase P family protein [Bacteroidota bacterium]
MRYDIIDNQLFISNRLRFSTKLKSSSVAIFNSNDIMPTNADGTMLFRQNNDLFYLCGIDQEETVLVICPDAPNPKQREMLFIKETNEKIETWEGKKLSKEEAKNISGIAQVHWLQNLQNILNGLVVECDNIYLNSNEHIRSKSHVESRDQRWIKQLKQQFPLHNYERIAKIMNELRPIKHSIEIALINTAIDITAKAFQRVLKFVKPGVAEYEIEAEITHDFLWNRATRHAYTPIIASGGSSCILHYITNNKICNDGEVLLLDFGAEYANYAADLTRTIPISGRFSDRQRKVYQSVLNIQKEAKKMLIKGNNLEIYHKEVGKIVEKELVELSLLKSEDIKNQTEDNPLYKKYFMHGTSHYLGLDVHDVGSRYRKFEPGMVFTCEPGIYIKEEGIGIRLENNILITETGNIDLMEQIPIEIDEIETLMKK